MSGELTPFAFAKDIVSQKQYIYEPDTASSYVPFIVNRDLSLNIATLGAAMEADRLHHMPKKMQHDFLFYSVPKQKKPFIKWPKKPNSELLDITQKLYNVGPSKAREILDLLEPDQVQQLRQIEQSVSKDAIIKSKGPVK